MKSTGPGRCARFVVGGFMVHDLSGMQPIMQGRSAAGYGAQAIIKRPPSNMASKALRAMFGKPVRPEGLPSAGSGSSAH